MIINAGNKSVAGYLVSAKINIASAMRYQPKRLKVWLWT
jgi:hypothetical protein